MQIVIDIPDDFYEKVQDNYRLGNGDVVQIPIRCIANGTPLTKGHGRLKDADDIPNQIELKGFLQQDDAHLVTIQRVKEALDEAPTIIEADTESEE